MFDRLPSTLSAQRLCLAASLVVTSLVAGPLSAAELRPVPNPSLSGSTADVRESIQEAQRRVDSLRSQPGPLLADAYGELGKLYLHFGFSQAAEPALDNAARLEDVDPNVPNPWHYYLAVAQERNGDLSGAAQSLRTVLKAREGNLPAVLRLAGVLMELGENQEAQFLYQAALQSPLGKAAGHAGLAQLAMDESKPLLAIEHLQAALEEQPQADALRYRLGLAYRDAGEMDKARELLKQPGGQDVQYPDPLMIQLALQMEGQGSEARAGGLAAQRGELAEAIESYRRAIAQNPGDQQSRRSLAAALFESGDLSGAEKEFQEILRRDPQNASAHLELGSVAIAKAGRPDAGLKHLEKAVETAPEFREARVRLARSLVASGKLDQALPHLEKAVELDPRDSDGRLRYARALMEMRRTDDAARQVAELLAQEPDNLDGILLRGRIHAINGNPGAAEKEFSRLTELSTATRGQRARAHFNMALLRQAQNRIPEAVDFYRRAIDLDRTHRQALFNLAVIVASNNRLAEAEKLYQQLYALDPGQSDIRYRLAVTQMSQGKLETASDHFESLHRQFPQAIEFLISSSLLLAELDRADEAAERLLAAISKVSEKGPQARLKSTLGAVEIKNGRLERGLGHFRSAVQQAPKMPEIRKRYAEALAGEKRYDQAVEQYEAYQELAPGDPQATFAHATCLILLKRWRGAVDLLTTFTQSSPDLAATHLLARLLASAPEPEVRDGERAVQISQAVFNAARNPAHGETLAMSMAAAGRWDEAVTLQTRLLDEAKQAGFDAGFIERVESNLARYQQQQLGRSDW